MGSAADYFSHAESYAQAKAEHEAENASLRRQLEEREAENATLRKAVEAGDRLAEIIGQNAHWIGGRVPAALAAYRATRKDTA